MHNVLYIDELIREIFRWSSLQDLPVAARTCQAWKDPALDALYWQLTSLQPLAHILPDGKQLTPLTGRQLSLFTSYARRVRHLMHSTKLSGRHDIPKLLDDHAHSIPNCLFPRLRTARITLTSKAPSSLHPALSLSPELRELHLDEGFTARKGVDHITDYLTQVAVIAPRLESLTLRGSMSIDTNIQLSFMKNLQTLRLRTADTLTAESLALISKFPQLSFLEVHARRILSADLEHFWGTSPELPTFPALESLWIRCQSDLFCLLAESITSTKLHTLHLDLESAHQPTHFWDSLLRSICSSSSHTLQDLSIMHLLDHDDVVDSWLRGANTIAAKDLYNISQCRQLRRISFTTTLPANVRNADFTQMAKWWPDLESLEFSSEISSEGSANITFDALRIIATSLPKLTFLALPVDTAGITEEVVTQLDVAGHRKLRTLSIMFPHLPDISLLPRYLYKLFPDLPEVEYSSEQWFADWVKVTSGVRGLQLKCVPLD